MANLNFQQPPRSIASGSLSNRSTGGFNTNSLSGHVTPTSGMFSSNNTNYGPTQSQLSPNRNVQLSSSSVSSVGGNSGVGGSINTGGSGSASLSQISNSGRTNIFGQRAFTDRRTMQQSGLGTMVCNKTTLL